MEYAELEEFEEDTIVVEFSAIGEEVVIAVELMELFVVIGEEEVIVELGELEEELLELTGTAELWEEVAGGAEVVCEEELLDLEEPSAT